MRGVVEHRLGEDAPLDARVHGRRFRCGRGRSPGAPADAAERLVDGTPRQPEFAPIVLIELRGTAGRGPRPGTVCSAFAAARSTARALRPGAAAAAARAPAVPRRAARPAEFRAALPLRRSHDPRPPLHQAGRHRAACARIYLAESERAGSVVVLKVFSQVPDVSERLIGFDRFLQEYEIVAGLNHHNIVRIYDLGIADDHAYIAMEHFPRGDLRQRMKAPLAAGRRSRLSAPDRERPRCDPFGGRAAPGPQAGQHHAAHRRFAVSDRLRTGQGQCIRVGAHRHARDIRHAVLHEPRAGARRRDRSAQRPVQSRRHLL